MLCEECNINEATVSVSVIVNGESTIRRLCPACMKKKSLDLVRGNLGSFLGSVLAVMNDHSSSSSDMAKACSKCGLTWTEFKKTGHLGCSDCYDAFADELKPVLQKIHGCAQHIGRTPDMLQNEPKYILFQTMQRLQEKMAKAIADENYEEAAQIRDEIKRLTHQEDNTNE